MDIKSIPDEDLVMLLKNGSHSSFTEIYRRYWKELFLVAYRKLHNKELAEELTQNLFLSLWEKRNTAAIQVIRPYLFVSLKYSIINYFKAQLVSEKYLIYKQSSSPDTANADQLALINDLAGAIEKGIAMLPRKTKRVFELSRYENCSVKEIAAYMNISEKAVEYHITRSLKTMRVYLKDFIFILLASESIWRS